MKSNGIKIKIYFTYLGGVIMAQYNQSSVVNQFVLSNKSLLAALLFLGVGGGVGYWYYLSRLSKQQVAQRVYAEALDEYMRGVAGSKDAWPNLETLVDVSYAHHESSVFAPYLLMLKAESLLWQSKLDDAIDVMQKAMQSIPVTSPLYFPYSTKLALMLIDSAQGDRNEKGVIELQKLAEDPANAIKDEARCALATHYLNKGNKEEAYALLDLVIQESKQNETSSPWVIKAKKIMNSDV